MREVTSMFLEPEPSGERYGILRSAAAPFGGPERKTGLSAQRPARFLAREDCRLRVLRAA